jgi:hypothetical protein
MAAVVLFHDALVDEGLERRGGPMRILLVLVLAAGAARDLLAIKERIPILFQVRDNLKFHGGHSIEDDSPDATVKEANSWQKQAARLPAFQPKGGRLNTTKGMLS